MAVEGTLEITISNQVVTPVIKNIAPVGFHVPSDAEFYALEKSLDPTINDNTFEWRGINTGTKLKEEGTDHWIEANGTNETGFSATGSGRREETGGFDYLKYQALYWTTDSIYRFGYYFMLQGIGPDESKSYRAIVNKKNGMSIRCVKDSTALSIGQRSSVTGISGTIYPTKCMPDGKEWMIANLKETQFNDGTAIPNVTDNTEWSELATPAYCWYDNIPN
jgi:uncharacterized protein (TIGR02145 family)